MPHIVLLGDSIFDNAAYVRPGEPDVVRQLRARLPAGARATLAAGDGATAADVRRQLERLPADATHLIVGGNDALGDIGVLDEPAHSIADALTRLADIGDDFEHAYRAMVRAVLDCGRPTALCTIYEPRYPDPRSSASPSPGSSCSATSSPAPRLHTACRCSTCAWSATTTPTSPTRSSPRRKAATRSRRRSPGSSPSMISGAGGARFSCADARRLSQAGRDDIMISRSGSDGADRGS